MSRFPLPDGRRLARRLRVRDGLGRATGNAFADGQAAGLRCTVTREGRSRANGKEILRECGDVPGGEVDLAAMVDLATTLSFLTTPVLAYISYRVIMLPNMPVEHVPQGPMRALSWAGIIFWSGFAVLFLAVKLIAR